MAHVGIMSLERCHCGSRRKHPEVGSISTSLFDIYRPMISTHSIMGLTRLWAKVFIQRYNASYKIVKPGSQIMLYCLVRKRWHGKFKLATVFLLASFSLSENASTLTLFIYWPSILGVSQSAWTRNEESWSLFLHNQILNIIYEVEQRIMCFILTQT